jgi:hypothetical protein
MGINGNGREGVPDVTNMTVLGVGGVNIFHCRTGVLIEHASGS